MSAEAAGQLLVVQGEKVVARELVSEDEGALLAQVDRQARLHPDAWVLAELREGELTYGWCRRPHDETLFHSVFYNDFDDYEDDIAIGDDRWLGAVLGAAR